MLDGINVLEGKLAKNKHVGWNKRVGKNILENLNKHVGWIKLENYVS